MDLIKKLKTVLREEIFENNNQVLFFSWIGAICLVLTIGLYLGTQTKSFLGVAESRESHINFENPVEIRAVHVIPGKTVKKGELLIEVNQTDINQRLREANDSLQKLEVDFKLREKLNSIIQSENQSENDPLVLQLKQLKKEIAYLEAQKRNLYVFAEVDGVVGAVNFKKGERVPAFSPILTLSPIHPSFVQGYVNENIHTQIQVGQQVKVDSVATGDQADGTIVSVGSRIVNIPARLLHNPNIVSWGREITVSLDNSGKFLLGEKVQIKPFWAILKMSSAIAETQPPSSKKPSAQDPAKLEISESILDHMAVEPSGLVYLADLKKYLVISDESRSLLLMSEEGVIDDTFNAMGLEDVDDLESVSVDGDLVYLLSSMSNSKKGKAVKNREYLVVLERQGLDFKLKYKMNFKKALLKAFKNSQMSELQEIENTVVNSDAKPDDLEIEAHFVNNNKMFMILKKPKMKNNQVSVIIINDLQKTLLTKIIEPQQIKVWQNLVFPENLPYDNFAVSDMALVGPDIYLTTSCSKELCSAVWKYSAASKGRSLELIRSFNSGKLEGLSKTASESELMGVFDDDGRNPRYVKISIQ
jgi:hypothetical protein